MWCIVGIDFGRMRSRPKVKTYLRPAIATPGQTLEVEVVLTSASETPVDYVEMKLEGTERAQFGRSGLSQSFLALAARHGPRTLGIGEHRLAGRFELPPTIPPTYRGGAASIEYTLAVHVSIPWWPDRRQSFTIPVAPIAAPFAPTPQTVVTAMEGPRGTAPYVEASYDSTTLEIGGELAGAVSIANVLHTKIRGVDLELIGTELPRAGIGSYVSRRLRWRIFDGAPPEGQPIPFRVSLTHDLGIGVIGNVFELTWHLEVTVDVAWDFDAKLRTPVTLVPAGSSTPSVRGGRAAARWVAPVGRERRALIWATVAEKRGMINDAEQEKMTASIGPVALVVHLEQRGVDGLFSIATLRWPHLGMELHAEQRSWTDVLSVGTVDLGQSDGARRVTARAREAAQARAVLADDVLAALATFDEVRVDDERATVTSRGGAQTVPQLDAFVSRAILLAQTFAAAVARVPAPAKMAGFVRAWEALAQRLGGRFDRGAMGIREARLGTESIEIVTEWSRRGEIEGTVVRVLLSPPLDHALDLTSPELSREARDLAAAIATDVRKVRFGPDALEALVEGPLEDPTSVEPLLEKLARLARSARGAPAAGPFR